MDDVVCSTATGFALIGLSASHVVLNTKPSSFEKKDKDTFIKFQKKVKNALITAGVAGFLANILVLKNTASVSSRLIIFSSVFVFVQQMRGSELPTFSQEGDAVFKKLVEKTKKNAIKAFVVGFLVSLLLLKLTTKNSTTSLSDDIYVFG